MVREDTGNMVKSVQKDRGGELAVKFVIESHAMTPGYPFGDGTSGRQNVLYAGRSIDEDDLFPNLSGAV